MNEKNRDGIGLCGFIILVWIGVAVLFYIFLGGFWNTVWSLFF
jgi:hypothetical protein